MRGVANYSVIYDLGSNRERARVNKILKGFGFRVQKSVFECRMDKRGKNKLIEALEKLGLTSGFIKIYRLEYSSKNLIIGKKEKKDIDAGHAYII